MLVRMCSIMANPVHGNARHGDVVSVPTEFGEGLIANREAMPYVPDEAPKPKKVVVKRGRRPGRQDSASD